MKDIVITAGTALGSVLALAEAITLRVNCKAYVLCTDKVTSGILASSRFVKQVTYIEAENEQDYVVEIQNWYKRTQFKRKPILYFTTDTACFYIDNNRDWFEDNFKLCLPSSEIIQSFTQKGLAEIKAIESGLTVPKTKVIKDIADIDTVIENFNFPIILKPRATYLKEGLNFKIKVIKDKKSFSVFSIEHIENKNTLLCQEFIPGGDDTSYYYLFYRNKHGDIFENVGRKTLQSTSDGGIMLKGITEYNEKISTICRRFLSTIDYQGIGGIEFKKHNDQFYFIEMSVRLEGFFKISEISETPLALISYYYLSENSLPRELRKNNQKDNYIYIDLIPTLINHIKNRSFTALFSDSLNVLFNPKVKMNAFSNRDYKPFILKTFNLIRRN